MEHLSLYIDLTFYLTAFVAALLAWKAARYAWLFTGTVAAWMLLQFVMARSGFYMVTSVLPPRLGWALFPPLIVTGVLFITTNGKRFLDGLDIKTLTLLHVVRVPVELILYWLFVQKMVPRIMTFEGRNFDILCGLTAPLVYYFGYVKPVLGRRVILAWNIICLLVVTNIVVIAVLSAPFPIQRFGFEQPNVALLYAPYIWLPGVLVPLVIFAHLAAIRAFMRGK